MFLWQSCNMQYTSMARWFVSTSCMSSFFAVSHTLFIFDMKNTLSFGKCWWCCSYLTVPVCDMLRSGVVVPGNCLSVARQFLRCVLHQLAPNNVFPQIFMSCLGGLCFCRPVPQCLAVFWVSTFNVVRMWIWFVIPTIKLQCACMSYAFCRCPSLYFTNTVLLCLIVSFFCFHHFIFFMLKLHLCC